MAMFGVWVQKSLRYYAGRHAAFAATVALTSAVLCAALLTGDSLRAGLQRDLRARLGSVRSAVVLREGVFPASLAQRLPETQAALVLRGELLDAEGALCANDAQLLGLASMNGASVFSAACPNARARAVLPGSEGAVRFAKPALFAAELPLGAAKEKRWVRRPVRWGSAPPTGLLTPDFALRPGSTLPLNACVPLDALSEAAGVPGLANLLVSSQPPEAFERALAAALTPEDAGLSLTETNGATVVTSRRVFLPRGVSEALARAGLAPAPATFHLADAFEAGTNATPYGFVAAVAPGGAGVPSDLKDDEAVVNAWLAQALGVRVGDTLTLRWRRFEAGGRLIPESATFRVRGVLPTEKAAEARALMPVFPGLADVDSCAAWDVGMPMDEDKLKDAANEAYWKQWRETPKVFLTFAAGRACFGTVFGEAMSVRVAADAPTVRRALAALTPAQRGFDVRPVWDEGVRAAQGSTDFRALFVGLAFVLIAASLLLSALSLALALESRKGDVALFRAVGWSRSRVAWTLAAEGCAPIVAGAAAGGVFGAALARALVWSLERFWRGAFAGAEIGFQFSWAAAGLAAGVAAVLTLAVLLVCVWRAAGRSPAEIWRGDGDGIQEIENGKTWGAYGASAAGGVFAVGALGLMLWSPSGAAANGVFFGAGCLLMVSLLLFAKTAADAWALGRGAGVIASPLAAGVCRAAASPRRCAPVVILLAVGTFLTVGILSMRNDPAAGCERSSSGSGGFASLVSSVAPLDREAGLALARRASGGQNAVPVRVHEGDEAGCLNMSAPQTPRLLGVDARTMARLRAFEPENAGGVWTPIEDALGDGTIPALAADETMLTYSLQAKAGAKDGAVWSYAGADGRVWRVRVVGALPVRSGILQGALIVDERLFAAMFPEEGYRLWLCDGVRPQRGPLSNRADAEIRAGHPEPGVTVQTAQARLRLLGAVEGAYIDMFLVLGGLGVVLGVAGIALVVWRGAAERRGEWALLGALGLPPRTAAVLLAAEYGVMALVGLVAGLVPALVAVQPAARALRGDLPWGAMAGIVAGLVICTAASVLIAARVAPRRWGPEALKEEV